LRCSSRSGRWGNLSGRNLVTKFLFAELAEFRAVASNVKNHIGGVSGECLARLVVLAVVGVAVVT
jgi:hypothetical protein